MYTTLKLQEPSRVSLQESADWEPELFSRLARAFASQTEVAGAVRLWVQVLGWTTQDYICYSGAVNPDRTWHRWLFMVWKDIIQLSAVDVTDRTANAVSGQLWSIYTPMRVHAQIHTQTEARHLALVRRFWVMLSVRCTKQEVTFRGQTYSGPNGSA